MRSLVLLSVFLTGCESVDLDLGNDIAPGDTTNDQANGVQNQGDRPGPDQYQDPTAPGVEFGSLADAQSEDNRTDDHDVEILTLANYRNIERGFVLFNDDVVLAGMDQSWGYAKCFLSAVSGGVGDDEYNHDDDDCDDSYDHDDPYGSDDDDGGEIEPYALLTGRDKMVLLDPPSGIHDQNQVWRNASDIPAPGALEARLWDGGAVALIDDGVCAAQWVDLDFHSGEVTDRHRHDLDRAWCGVGVTLGVDRDSGDLLLAGPAGVASVRPGKVTPLAGPADAVAWDDARAQGYAAPAGETTLEAFDASGEVRWTADLGLPINAVAALADTGAVIAHAGLPGAPGRVVVLDGSNGQEKASLEGYYRDVARISVSPSGRTASLWSPTEDAAWTLRILIDAGGAD
jgi:hypothetical protein